LRQFRNFAEKVVYFGRLVLRGENNRARTHGYVFQVQQETIEIIVDRVVQGHDILQGMHAGTLQTNDRVRETELLHYGRRGGSIIFLEIRLAFTTESSRYKRPVIHFRYPLDAQVDGLGE
jgi:hypothetical protein